MKKVDFGWKYYFQPTPKRLRVFGDSLAAAGTLGASIAVLNGHPIVGTVVMVLAVIGKFISNFFIGWNQKAKSNRGNDLFSEPPAKNHKKFSQAFNSN